MSEDALDPEDKICVTCEKTARELGEGLNTHFQKADGYRKHRWGTAKLHREDIDREVKPA